MTDAHLGEIARATGSASPFDDSLGLVLDTLTPELVTGTLEVDPSRHAQPVGLVHGGVYCAMVETLASVGAALVVVPQGLAPMGMENHTSFLRPVSGGTLHGEARPVSLGRQTHLWEVTIRDDRGQIAARGSLRLAIREPREPSDPSS